MTCCIMAIKDDTLYVSSDSCTSFGYEKSNLGLKKIRLIGGYAALCSGTVSLIQALENFALPDSTLTDDEYVSAVYIPTLRAYLRETGLWNDDKACTILDLEFATYIRGKMYIIDSHLARLEQSEFCSVGNGAATAMGVMDVLWDSGMSIREMMQTALETAAKYNLGVEAPFHIEEIKLTDVKSKKKRRKSS